MSEFGPKITIKTEHSCRDCKALRSESYAVQSDTGFYHYCAHPSLPAKVRIPGHGTDTPDWCAALSTRGPIGAVEPAIDVNEALEAVDTLYDLMQQQATAGQRIDAKIALKYAILALSRTPGAGNAD